MKKELRTQVAVLILILHSSACYSWVPAPAGVDVPLLTSQTKSVRVVVSQPRMTVMVHEPIIVGDSLVGWSTPKQTARVSVPLSQITELDVSHFNPARSVLLGLAILPVAAIAVFVIGMSTCDERCQ
jgi:hypothetical protein